VSEAILLTGAEIEFHQIYSKLAESSFTRADRFDRTIHEALRQLAIFSRSAPEDVGSYRRLVLRGFPYALYYTIEGPRVFVQALVDTRQHPESIRRRLGL
jgi:plasmid stabilization system protein ParE